MNLLEFITKTKGIEYLIAIAFLFFFIAFWFIINHRSKNTVLKIVPVIVLALGFSGMAYTCSGPGAKLATADLSAQVPLLASPVLTEMYGPASFDHNAHQSVVDNCTVCHHHSGNDTPLCKSCHSDSSSSDDPNKPGIAHVYHLRCISCHTEGQAGPTECTGCHNQASVPPLSMGHPLAGIENCVNCHRGGVEGVPVMPADHTDATNGVCQLCHSTPAQPAGNVTKSYKEELIR